MRLRDALQCACQARLEENQSGMPILSATGNGSSITFGLPQLASTLTPESVLAAVSQLYDLYENAVAQLGVDSETASDAAIAARMLALLVPVRSRSTDFSQVCTA